MLQKIGSTGIATTTLSATVQATSPTNTDKLGEGTFVRTGIKYDIDDLSLGQPSCQMSFLEYYPQENELNLPLLNNSQRDIVKNSRGIVATPQIQSLSKNRIQSQANSLPVKLTEYLKPTHNVLLEEPVTTPGFSFAAKENGNVKISTQTNDKLIDSGTRTKVHGGTIEVVVSADYLSNSEKSSKKEATASIIVENYGKVKFISTSGGGDR